MTYFTITKFTIIIIFVVSCKHKAVVPPEPEISFVSQVQPVIVNNCAQSNCHDGSSQRFSLTNYTNITNNLLPGNANSSNIYSVIKNRSMPPSHPLTDEQAKLVYIWIMQGAKNN